ncbi:hypothetical protein MF265_23295 [Serratia marcescens]|uniref:hypothetical protein n=1 Tax=Serratia marcescens TaxID=615 RepID=UPI001EF0327C|nr:hypothetical protein [Serratia marcescens]ULH10802.1 hypothetical protein MF265_23295 [Serratia marcescens]
MKYEATGLTTAQAAMALIGLIIFMVGIYLFFPWLMLLAWNLLASSAGWSAVPVNWGTVCGLALVMALVRCVFRRDKA